LENKKNNSKINILLYEKDIEFSNFLKKYLEFYDLNVFNISDFNKIFEILNIEKFDFFICHLEENSISFDFVDFFDKIKELKNNTNIKILFSGLILPKEDVFKFLEKKEAFFIMKYSLPFEWINKIKAIIRN
jgi:DNA-binding response OmpR family regulator